jgi:hypothetical protein
MAVYYTEYIAYQIYSNRLGCNDEHFHEKLMGELTSALIHHRIEISCKVPMDVERAPAGLTEWAGEEEVKGCFFPVTKAQMTGHSCNCSPQACVFSF